MNKNESGSAREELLEKRILGQYIEIKRPDPVRTIAFFRGNPSATSCKMPVATDAYFKSKITINPGPTSKNARSWLNAKMGRLS